MGKKVFYVALGYAIGNIVSSLYNTKSSKSLKEEIHKKSESGEDIKKPIIDNFVNTQKAFYVDMKEKFADSKTNERIKEKTEEVKTKLEAYKIEAENMLKDMEKKGKVYASQVSDKLEAFYKEKKEEGVSDLKEFGEAVVTEFQEKFRSMIDSLKSKKK